MTQQIAIVGASSQIAKDLIRSFAAHGRSGLLLYVRDVDAMNAWLLASGLAGVGAVLAYERYGEAPHAAVLNFVGVGDPHRAAAMGASIFEITQRFDDLVMAELARHPQRRYVFLSSGAAYGNAFEEPANAQTQARIPINAITPQDYYATAKLHAEVRHRARPDLAVVDLRVFNYFSRTQDVNARFFITDIARAVQTGEILRTSADFMVRDYLHPADFHQLVTCVLEAAPANCAVDCYSRAPVDKPTLLQAMHQRFGLRYEIAPAGVGAAPNATGAKPNYYSLNRIATRFGYSPALSSIDGVLEEMAALLA
jgi:nucleoside-diphosphate-sugar epimerase